MNKVPDFTDGDDKAYEEWLVGYQEPEDNYDDLADVEEDQDERVGIRRVKYPEGNEI